MSRNIPNGSAQFSGSYAGSSFILLQIYIKIYYRPQRSCGKVIFPQASVSHSVYRGCLPQCKLGYTPPLARHPPGRYPQWADTPGWTPPRQSPPPAGHCCRWYASYWNAFLFNCAIVCMFVLDTDRSIIFYSLCSLNFDLKVGIAVNILCCLKEISLMLSNRDEPRVHRVWENIPSARFILTICMRRIR